MYSTTQSSDESAQETVTFGRTLVDREPDDNGLTFPSTVDGEIAFFQAMVMDEEMGDDSVFTSPPPVLQRMLTTMFGPIGRLLGYCATYSRYNEDTFWESRVEQLPTR
ncbi:MAG: hypothetical protein U5K37_05465 [Natrialbaceae archaeon]|nr:hypothetical protein [Natrialbaceae archaeon]